MKNEIKEEIKDIYNLKIDTEDIKQLYECYKLLKKIHKEEKARGKKSKFYNIIDVNAKKVIKDRADSFLFLGSIISLKHELMDRLKEEEELTNKFFQDRPDLY